jgi:lantibiotic leader peptide-processing serine protease
MRSRISFVVLASLALAACSTDMVAPPKAPPTLKLSKSLGDGGNYLVLMSGTSVPTGFADKVASLGGKVRTSHSGAGFAVVSGITDAGAVQLAATTGVAEVDRDAPVGLELPIVKVTSDATDLGSPSTTSVTNPAAALHFDWQWNMRLIQADKAWVTGKLGSPNVTVAILDTGIDYDGIDLNGHVDLARSVSFMSAFVGGPGEVVTPSDDDLVTAIFPGRNKISDLNGHGTNVASQVTSNGLRLAGVTSKTTLIGVKVLGANGFGTFGGILSGILWAADHDADVANMSLGGSFSRAGNGQLIRVINAVFNYAKRKGMVVVVSAGNDGIDLDHNGNTFAGFCDATHVICVASVGPPLATSNPDTPAFYTNFGRHSIDVAAPGGNAVFPALTPSAWPWGVDIASWVWSRCSRQELVFDAKGNPFFDGCGVFFNYNGFIGTSQAAPHVSGLAALLVADNGHANPQKIKKLIENSGDPINPLYGKGRINVQSALALRLRDRDENR